MNPVEEASTTATTTRFGRLNARKKHNLPYIETIHIQPDREERFIIVAWKMLESFLKKGCCISRPKLSAPPWLLNCGYSSCRRQ